MLGRYLTKTNTKVSQIAPAWGGSGRCNYSLQTPLLLSPECLIFIGMRNIFQTAILLLLTLVFYNCGHAQPKATAKYDYALYLPKDYSTNTTKKYPLIIYLHGSSQRGNDLEKLKGYGLPYLVDKGQDFEFIIASPQCPSYKQWYTDNWFETLFQELTAKYRIDISRVYLTGVSMGGYGTFITALDFPDIFAAIVPLCGGVTDKDLTRLCNISKVPVWTFHGTADYVIPISETERVETGLKKCKGNIQFTRLEDEGHQIHYLYEQKPEIYEWLLKHKKVK